MNIDAIKINENLSVINALDTKIYYEDSKGTVKMIMPNQDMNELSKIEFQIFDEGDITFNLMQINEKFSKLLEQMYKEHEDSLLIILPLDKMLLSPGNVCSLGTPIKTDEKGRTIYSLNNLYIR